MPGIITQGNLRTDQTGIDFPSLSPQMAVFPAPSAVASGHLLHLRVSRK